MVDYNPNGEKVFKELTRWLEDRAYTDWAVLVADFAHYNRNDTTSYVLEKWWKYCDEIAEYILWDDTERASDWDLVEPITCEECGEISYEIDTHDSDCSQN